MGTQHILEDIFVSIFVHFCPPRQNISMYLLQQFIVSLNKHHKEINLFKSSSFS